MFTVNSGCSTYKVEFRHFQDRSPVQRTLCVIKKDEDEVSAGWSIVHPKDQYCRNTGRKVSLSRALDVLFEPRDEKRQLFWDAYYHARGGKW